ncbi:TetR/AcrR family transcriptional regulator [Mesorhizobium sp. M0510]|uniref:TetR/AcrR family transcriptional regulator n=1 Tax=Mesorhizobium sp. M0510 TaxID=2956954 RepID=UPI003336F57A
MRTVDEANTEQKRAVVLRAAMRCFAQNGLQKTSISDICKAAGMRSGHVYYYFPSKDAIVEAAFRIGMDDLITHVEEMMDGEDFVSLIVDIHSKAERDRRSWDMTPGLRLEFLAESARNPRLMAIENAQDERLVQATLRVVYKAMAAGRLDSRVDPLAFSHAIILLWSGFALARLSDTFDLDVYRDAIKKLIAPWLISAGMVTKPASEMKPD